MSETFDLILVSAGTSDPSSTRLLADRIAQRAAGASGLSLDRDLLRLATGGTAA